MTRKTLLPQILIAIFILFFSNFSQGQTFTDHNSQTLFNILPQQSFSYSIGGTSADITYLFGRYNKKVYYKGKAVPTPLVDITIAPAAGTNFTTADNSLFFVTASVSNVNKDYKSFFSNLNQPTISVGAAWAYNNVLWMNWNKLTNFKQFNAYVKVFANNTISDYYDNISKDSIAAKKWPLFNYGLEVNLTNFSSKTVWLNFTASVTHGMPTDTLKSYQNSIPDPVNTSNPTVVPIGDIAGLYGGAFIKNQWNYRLAFTPVLFFKDKSPICAFPFYELYGSSNNKWTNLVGGSIGILGKKFDISKGSISPVLEIGMDWNSNASTHNGWSSPNYILSFKGSFSL